MNYLCRTLGPAAALLADLFSKQILNTAASIHGYNTATAPLWTLKIKDGGLGLQLPSLLLTPAYLSSLCLKTLYLAPGPPYPKHMHSYPLSSGITSNQNHSLRLKNFSEKLPRTPAWTIYTSPDAPQKKLQKELTGPVYHALQKAYRSNLTLNNTMTPSPTQNLARGIWWLPLQTT
jgi:hypothetical protein